ncbi:uncharacterized protein LOC142992871 [Genypterus blacodes]|uniref:uncharacterized protein LOC142992871 n=1 Tax=Genypterus blacodes TaxID=154954 RepID=UPI003F758FCA
MTRKLQNPSMDDTKSRKRILKPVVEKKRRDRINQSLAELRTLLLNYTSDTRLQNPKIEKAEILDVAVEYLHQWTGGKKDSYQVKTPVLSLHHPESSPPSLSNMETAGFQQCVAQLSSYMHTISPAQRSSLIQGLRIHTEGQSTTHTKPARSSSCSSSSSATDLSQRMSDPEVTAASLDMSSSEQRDDSPVFLCHPLQPALPFCSTPSHDSLTPPPSPYLSPLFPSFTCHFSFPPSLSPLSSNTSFSTLSQSVPLNIPVFSPALPLPAPHFASSSLTHLRSPPHLVQRDQSPAHMPMWRPW